MLITSPAMNFLLVHYEKNKTGFYQQKEQRERQCGSLIKTGDFHIYYVFKLKRVCNSATFFVFFSWFFLFFLRTFLGDKLAKYYKIATGEFFQLVIF